MKFPLQKGARFAVQQGKCTACGKTDVGEPHGFAFLNGGALKRIDQRTSMPSGELEGFLAVGYHGAHGSTKSEASAMVSVAEEVPAGQFEYYFCSTFCLRQFLNGCIDELEHRLASNDG